jgi:hypothetical protein
MVEKGVAWGRPAAGPPDVEVTGGDAALAAAIVERDHPRVWFRPDDASDLARAIGLAPAVRHPDDPRDAEVPGGTELALDALRVETPEGAVSLAVNAVVLGTAPDRQRRWSRATPVHVTVDDRTVHDGPASAVVVATGEFLRGADLTPRGHPGDGRAEVQVYALRPGERAGMRARLPTGSHVPHPRIRTAAGRRVTVRARRPMAVELDGEPAPAAVATTVEVLPEAFSVLV